MALLVYVINILGTYSHYVIIAAGHVFMPGVFSHIQSVYDAIWGLHTYMPLLTQTSRQSLCW